MTYLSGVLQTILPVICVIVIGIICRKKNILSRNGVDALKTVAVNIALPAVMLNAFATMTYTMRNVLVPLLLFGICFVAWFLGKLVKRIVGVDDKFLPYLTTGYEAGMLGYTLFTMLYGEEHIASFAIVDLGQVLFVFTLYKVLLNAELTGAEKRQSVLKSMITSPIIIAIAAGVLIGATGLYDAMKTAGVHLIFDHVVSFVAAPTSVLILLSIGYDLVLNHIPWKKVIQTVAVRFNIMLALMVGVTLVLGKFVEGDPMLLRAVWVMFILPPPYVLPIFADDESQYTYLSSTLTVYTLLSIVCFAILAFVS